MSVSVSPRSRRRIASLRWCGVSLKGRPKLCPRALACCSRPSPVRARINSRSNSASPPRTVSIKRPCAVVVSAQASARDRNPAFLPVIAARVLRRSRGGACQQVEPRHRYHVAGANLGQQPAKLGPGRSWLRSPLPGTPSRFRRRESGAPARTMLDGWRVVTLGKTDALPHLSCCAYIWALRSCRAAPKPLLRFLIQVNTCGPREGKQCWTGPVKTGLRPPNARKNRHRLHGRYLSGR